MEKRFTLALVLSLVVLVGWQMLNSKPPTPQDEVGENKDGQPEAGEPGGGQPEAVPEKPAVLEPAPMVSLADVTRLRLENDRLRLEFSNLGGVLEQAELLDFRPEAASPVGDALKLLVPSDHGLCALRLDDRTFPGLSVGSSLWGKGRKEGRSVIYARSFTRKVEGREITYELEKRFTLPAGTARHLELEITWRNPGDDPTRALRSEFSLMVSGGVFQELGGVVMSPPRTAFYPFEDDVEIVIAREVAKETEQADVRKFFRGEDGGFEKSLESGHRYVSDLSNYHGAFLLLQDFPSELSAVVYALNPGEEWHFMDRLDQGSQDIRTCSFALFESEVAAGEEQTWKGLLYLGPVDDVVIGEDLAGVLSEGEIDDLGEVYSDQLTWARPIARLVLAGLRGLHGIVGNWGWSIVLLTVCVRILLFPINRKSQAAMLRVQEGQARVKPKLDKLKEKYKDDQKKFYEEQMKLFREEKVPLFPLGGCLPIFLQIPIFFGLFAALRSSIDLRQASWFWVSDLSQPDHLVRFDVPVMNPMAACTFCCGQEVPPITGFHILPILMTIAWVANSYFMPKPAVSNPQYEQQRKMMTFMPLLFGLFMYSYAAGLSLYWLTSSVLGIFESRVIKKFWPVGTVPEKAAP